MNPSNFKKLLEEALEPIRETQKEHTLILGGHSKTFKSQSETLKSLSSSVVTIKKTLKEHTETLGSLSSSVVAIKKTLKGHTETLASLSSSVVTIETTINVYGDMYKINDGNARKLEKRVITLEDGANIEPPSELILLKVQ